MGGVFGKREGVEGVEGVVRYGGKVRTRLVVNTSTAVGSKAEGRKFT